MKIEQRFWRSRIGELWKKGYKSKGVIHIGANDGYEVQWYKALGIENIICFEPYKLAHRLFKEKYPGIEIYNCALGDKNEIRKLNIASGIGGGSSLLEKDDEEWIGKTMVYVYRFDYFVKNNDIDVSLFDALVIDVQGFEMQVLKGIGKLINGFTRINIEVSKVPIYKGEAHGKEILNYLESKGFKALNEISEHDDLLLVK